jgi:hypothetical protein
MLFLPEGELHELTLLFSAFVIKCRNNQVIYLGQNVPLPDAKSTYEVYQPDYVLTVLTTRLTANKTQKFLDELSEAFPKSKLLIGGSHLAAGSYTIPDNAEVVSKLEMLGEIFKGQPSLSVL